MNITTQTFVIKIYKTYTKGILLIFNIFEHYLPYINNKNISNEAKEFKEKISNPYKYKKRKLKYKK